MKRTTVMLDQAVLAELERIARRSGRPTSHLIRESLKEYVARNRDEERRLPDFVGMGHGPGDVAEHDEEILRRELPSHIRDGAPTR